jgi:hypothetical protein
MCIPAYDEDGVERSLIADASGAVDHRIAGRSAPHLQHAAGIANESNGR